MCPKAPETHTTPHIFHYVMESESVRERPARTHKLSHTHTHLRWMAASHATSILLHGACIGGKQDLINNIASASQRSMKKKERKEKALGAEKFTLSPGSVMVLEDK